MRSWLALLAIVGSIGLLLLLRETRSARSAPFLAELSETRAGESAPDASDLGLNGGLDGGGALERRAASRVERSSSPTPSGRATPATDTPLKEVELHPLAVRVVRAGGDAVADAHFSLLRGGEEIPAVGDERGNYELQLPAGAWTIVPTAPEAHLVPDLAALAEPVVVPYGGPPLVYVLRERARLTGQVVDSAGAPVADAQVRASLPFLPERFEQVATDETGRFRFEELAVGELVLSAQAGNLETSRITTVFEGENPALSLQLPPGGWIVVRIHDADGSPRDDARAVVFRESRQLGNGEEPGVPLGPFAIGEVEVMAIYPANERGTEHVLTRRAQVVAGQTTEILIEPDATQVVVEGMVTLGEEPWANRVLFAFLEGQILTEGVQLLRTDAAGQYRLELPEPAAVVFAIDSDNHMRVVSHLSAPRSDAVRHDIAIATVELSGRIEGVREGEDWAVLLQPEPRAVDFTVPEQGGRHGVSDDGSFGFQALRPGDYIVWAWEDDGAIAGPVSVSLVEGRDVTDLRLLRREAGVLRGRVRDAAGTPVAGAVVHARTSNGRPHPYVARTDSAGSFRIPRLPAGEIAVCAQGSTTCALTRVRVEAGRDASVELTLSAGARIHARARDAEGLPCVASLRVFDPQGAEVSPWRGTGGSADSYSALVSTSEVTVGPLPPGGYEVVAETPDGRLARRSVTLGGSDVEVTIEL